MKKSVTVILAAVLLASLAAGVPAAWAQKGRRLHYSTLFNPRTLTTVSGEVVRVERVLAGSGADYCVQALLRTPGGGVTVIPAPQRYMEGQGLIVARGDRLTVTGSAITILGKPHLLATEVRGDRRMHLRDPSGRPGRWGVIGTPGHTCENNVAGLSRQSPTRRRRP